MTTKNKRTNEIKQYIKDNYKTMKVYIREDEYTLIEEHMKQKGYEKFGTYVKDLIAKDMNKNPVDKKNIHVQNSNGVVIGDNNSGIIIKNKVK